MVLIGWEGGGIVFTTDVTTVFPVRVGAGVAGTGVYEDSAFNGVDR